jgi:hypothetical protein
MSLITPDATAPLVHGTHCAGIGCEHDELALSGLEPTAPRARTTARHRGAASGRRVRVRLTDIPDSPRTAAHSAWPPNPAR